jgi:hypothetical protein
VGLGRVIGLMVVAVVAAMLVGLLAVQLSEWVSYLLRMFSILG